MSSYALGCCSNKSNKLMFNLYEKWFAAEEERLVKLQTFCKSMLLNPYSSNEIICGAVNKSSLTPYYVDPEEAQRRFIITKITDFEWDLSCPNFWAVYDFYKYKG